MKNVGVVVAVVVVVLIVVALAASFVRSGNERADSAPISLVSLG